MSPASPSSSQRLPRSERRRSPRPSRPQALVTGATGFIGRHLVGGLLESGYAMRAYVRDGAKAGEVLPPQVDVALGDLRDTDRLREAMRGARVVFHAAATVRTWGPWRSFEDATVAGTENVLRAAGDAGVGRCVHFSSVAVYHDRALAAGAVRETSPLTQGRWTDAFGFYGRSKMLAERAASRYADRNGLGVTVLRPAWVYGPHDDSILPYLRMYLRMPVAPWLGDSDPLMPFVYVTDVVEAAILAAGSERAAGRAYNVAGSGYPLRDFLWELADALGGRMPYFRVGPRWARAAALAVETLSLPLSSWLAPPITPSAVQLIEKGIQVDCSRARRELGWRPRVSMAEGLDSTLDWLRDEEEKTRAARRARLPTRALDRLLGRRRPRSSLVARATKV